MSVSYTHLDHVPPRPVLHDTSGELLRAVGKSAHQRFDPVSYTHLDVYKRQPHLLDSMIYYLTSGVFCYAKGSTKQTIHAGIQEAGRGNHDERKDELQRNGSTI